VREREREREKERENRKPTRMEMTEEAEATRAPYRLLQFVMSLNEQRASRSNAERVAKFARFRQREMHGTDYGE
jgi:hypothetical protein